MAFFFLFDPWNEAVRQVLFGYFASEYSSPCDQFFFRIRTLVATRSLSCQHVLDSYYTGELQTLGYRVTAGYLVWPLSTACHCFPVSCSSLGLWSNPWLWNEIKCTLASVNQQFLMCLLAILGLKPFLIENYLK